MAALRGSRIVRGRLLPGLDSTSPAVSEALSRWPGPVYVDHAEDGADVVLLYVVEDVRPRWWLHVGLLIVTLFTTLLAGALMTGVDPLAARAGSLLGLRVPVPTGLSLSALLRGIPFALPFVGILLAHEAGHYVAARRHRIPVTPPFFIPFPPYWSVIGTLGAFIRIKGPMVRRSILFDVGAAGPLVSFVLSVPTLLVGLALSSVAGGSATGSTPYVLSFGGQPIWLGESLLTHLAASAFFSEALGSAPIQLHPLAFAGWLGLFFTALNLLPFGQLDGGHVLYALAGSRQRRVARLALLALIPMGVLWWGWWFWAAVAVLVSRGRLEHPPVIQATVPLDPVRTSLAWCCVAILALTLVPLPIAF